MSYPFEVCEALGKGKGVFATKRFQKGDFVMDDMDEAVILTFHQFEALPPEKQNLCYEVARRIYIGPENFIHPSPHWFVNHSCAPNVVYTSMGVSVACRDIEVGEEICCDYIQVTCAEEHIIDIPECCCGSVRCRQVIYADDWKHDEFFFRFPHAFHAMRREVEEHKIRRFT